MTTRSDIQARNIIVFGASTILKELLALPIEIMLISDNDSNKWGTKIHNIDVVSPDQLKRHLSKETLVVIASESYAEAMKLQLIELGFSAEHQIINASVLIREWISDKHGEAMDRLRNIHQGQRAFLIGNGPSLQMADLDLLKDEITFGCNKIYLAYTETTWRPTYYCVEDKLVGQYNAPQIRELGGVKFFAHPLMPNLSPDPSANWLFQQGLGEVDGVPDVRFSKDLREGFYGGWTVIYLMMQLAWHMGIRELYLLGIDFHFEIPVEMKPLINEAGVTIQGDAIGNHFSKQYRNSSEPWFTPALQKQYEVFKYANEVFTSAQGSIVNCSRRTKLDVFPIRLLEDVMNG